MKALAASLAAVLIGLAGAGCGGNGAEPDGPQGGGQIGDPGAASLILDFQPNAVHTGLFSAQREGYFADAGLELTIREPSESSDGLQLLEAGTVDFAILDINDLGLARERGLAPVAIAAIVQRPLAAVIAADRRLVQRPLDLLGGTVGVTGAPSDLAVLETVLRSDAIGIDSVNTVTIGFGAVAALANAKVDAATAFWNAEGVELKRLRAPTIEFRVDQLGAPRYPELVLVTTPKLLAEDQATACALLLGLGRGYRLIEIRPKRALEDLLLSNRGIERGSQASQLDALLQANAFSRGGFKDEPSPLLETIAVGGWIDWAQENALIGADEAAAEKVFAGFDLELSDRCNEARQAASG